MENRNRGGDPGELHAAGAVLDDDLSQGRAEAPVDHDVGAGQVPRSSARQQDHDVGDLLGAGEPVRGRLLFRHVRRVAARGRRDGGSDTLVTEPRPGLDRARADRRSAGTA